MIAEQMKYAILSHGGVEGVRVVVVDVNFYSANARKEENHRYLTSSTTLRVEMRVSLPEERIESVQATFSPGGHKGEKKNILKDQNCCSYMYKKETFFHQRHSEYH